MIDYTFISRLEGGQLLHGYVPGGGGNASGVTIATGIDLGYYGGAFATLADGALKRRLLPYLGVIGAQAREILARTALTVTRAEADAIEKPKRDELLAALSAHYSRSAAHSFENIPDAAQTVLMSVTWQYGTPWVRTPNFWRICCRRDWQGAVAALRHFGDAYAPRRRCEADYLEKHLPRVAV